MIKFFFTGAGIIVHPGPIHLYLVYQWMNQCLWFHQVMNNLYWMKWRVSKVNFSTACFLQEPIGLVSQSILKEHLGSPATWVSLSPLQDSVQVLILPYIFFAMFCMISFDLSYQNPVVLNNINQCSISTVVKELNLVNHHRFYQNFPNCSWVARRSIM